MEPCPYCGVQGEHLSGCVMYGMSDFLSSALYGYPRCACCWMPDSDERTAFHEELAKIPRLNIPD